ncbi:glycosyltransferase family 4 protein [Salinibacter ruber]|uniref:glycosyltransferase family 4 protein n=1 Tax=Salinibacter ruber TaxID=146919 RepID=UPI002073B980|nr:glycosyltransferase family 4 protein [Salinibacter ruber]
MKVLISTIDYPPPPGGIQTVTKNLERGLNKNNVKNKVVHEDPGASQFAIGDYIPRVERLYSIKDILKRGYVFDNYLFRVTNRQINREKPDIVHSMHIKNWGSILAARKKGIPTIVSVHAKELGNEQFASTVLKGSDVIHCPSKYTMNLLRNLKNGDELQKKAYIIPPSIREKLYKKDRETTKKEKKVVCIARHVSRKNIKSIIQAWKMLGNYIKDKYSLYIVGDGPLRKKLVEISKGVDSIYFTGWVDEEKKRRLLEESDLFILTPTHTGYDVEGFGIVYLEAQAAGTPIVASKTGGIPEAVGKAGIFVEDEKNIPEIKKNMEKVIKTNRLKKRLIRNAKKRIKKFTVENIIQKHIKKYREIK